MAERVRWSRAGAKIVAAMAGVAGCLDENPKFVEPTSSSSGSQGGTSVEPPVESETHAPTTTSPATTLGPVMTDTEAYPSCGDGVVDAGEECDLGGDNSDAGVCTSSCKQAVCGDGHVHAGVEACDDQNDDATDGCVQCTAPKTCKELHAADPSAPTGVYYVDPDGPDAMQPQQVLCDMELRGGGWTLVERSPADDVIDAALWKDLPFNEAQPESMKFRLSREVMAVIRGHSSEMFLDCYGPDHLLASAEALFSGDGGPEGCDSLAAVPYAEAQFKGHLLMGVELCTRLDGSIECPGAWSINEWDQMICGLPEYPWLMQQHASPMPAAAFGVGASMLDPMHDCHTQEAARRILVR